MASTPTPSCIFLFEKPFVLNAGFDFKTINPYISMYYSKSRVIGFTATTLIIGVQEKGQKEYKVTFTISPEALQVICNCTPMAPTLCAHSFHSFCTLCRNNNEFFKIFEPGNRVSIALENKSIFHIDYSNPDEFIVPDKSLRHLYDFKVINPGGIKQLYALPATPNQEKNKIIVWLLVYCSYRWQSQVPFMVPVAGAHDKTGISIKSFGKGFENISTQTPDEQQLHILSKIMFAQTREENPWKLCDLLTGKNYISENYQHWKQAVPMLAGQQFVYKYRLAKASYFMKQAPRKSYLQKISLSTKQPQIQFLLKEKGNYYQLSIQFLVSSIPIKSPVADGLFFISDGLHYYLLGSLRDVAITYWMGRFHNVITVLKPSFHLFEKEILRGIEAMYPVVRR